VVSSFPSQAKAEEVRQKLSAEARMVSGDLVVGPVPRCPRRRSLTNAATGAPRAHRSGDHGHRYYFVRSVEPSGLALRPITN
jgi:hypothetical protein